MPKQPHITFQPLTLDIEQAGCYTNSSSSSRPVTMREHQQQSLPGFPEPPPNNLPFNDPLSF